MMTSETAKPANMNFIHITPLRSLHMYYTKRYSGQTDITKKNPPCYGRARGRRVRVVLVGPELVLQFPARTIMRNLLG
jgi:hypothetical protein